MPESQAVTSSPPESFRSRKAALSASLPCRGNAYSGPKHVRKVELYVQKLNHHSLLHVLSEITVLTRRFGVPVPGGVAAVTGGTDSENRQRTDRAEAVNPWPVSESQIGFTYIIKAPPRRAASAPCNAERSESIIDKQAAVGAFFPGVTGWFRASTPSCRSPRGSMLRDVSWFLPVCP